MTSAGTVQSHVPVAVTLTVQLNPSREGAGHAAARGLTSADATDAVHKAGPAAIADWARTAQESRSAVRPRHFQPMRSP